MAFANRRPLQAPRFELRFRRQIEAVHRLGPFALACLVEDLGAGADLRSTVSEYAALDPRVVGAFGGERFPPNLRAIGGES